MLKSCGFKNEAYLFKQLILGKYSHNSQADIGNNSRWGKIIIGSRKQSEKFLWFQQLTL